MRCTKCHYLSFEPEARCRNCGHDLSIDELVVSDLPLAAPESEEHQLDDFDLAETAIAGLGTATAVLAPPRRDVTPAPVSRQMPASMLAAPPTPSATAPAAAAVTAELPLFVRDMADAAEDLQEPLISVPVRPRPPIAVRRTTPDPARLRTKYAAPAAHERDLLDEPMPAVDPPRSADMRLPQTDLVPPRLPAAWMAPVTPGTRLAAATIDAGLLGAIAAVVTSFTLRFASVTLSNFGLQAAVPLVGFLLLIAAGYLLMFTAASGQTLGKMALGIRVVGTESAASGTDRVTIAQAALRAVTVLPSVLAFGVGFIPALLGGLAVHDRIAHTRVVRM